MFPVISVVMPCFNAESVIGKTLEDFANQTYKDFELVIVNDGSTDRSEQVSKDFIDRNSLTWSVVQQPNKGVSAARNTGMDLAKGAYIVFCDCDDRFEKNYLLDLHKKAVQDGSDAVLCGFDLTNCNNEFIESVEKSRLFPSRGKTGSEWLKQFITKDRNAVQLARILLKSEILKRNNIKFDESLRYCQDHLFMAEILFHVGKVSCVDKVLYHYVQWNGQSTKHSKEIADNRYVIELRMCYHLCSFLKENNVPRELINAVDKVKIPNVTMKDLAHNIRFGNTSYFRNMLKKTEYRENILKSQCMFCLLKKPETWFKGFQLLHCPSLFYKHYVNRKAA